MAFRWTLAIASRLHGLTQSTARVTSFDSTVVIRTFLSSRCYTVGRKPLPDEERQKRHEEAKARAYEKWHADPKNREKRLRRLRERYANDPQHREKRLRDFREKYANDPQFREQQHLRATKYYWELRSTLKQDPQAYRLYKDQIAERVNARYHGKVEYRWNCVLGDRLRKTPRYCDEVIWALHQPVLYPVKTNHTCATCGRKRYGGSKLWWQRKNESEKYDCFRCFAADREASTPIYTPPEFPPLPDRGLVQGPQDHHEKGDEGSGTGATT